MKYAAIITTIFAFSILVFTIYLLFKIRRERMKQLKELQKWDDTEKFYL